jgi:hypothetical protein
MERICFLLLCRLLAPSGIASCNSNALFIRNCRKRFSARQVTTARAFALLLPSWFFPTTLSIVPFSNRLWSPEKNSIRNRTKLSLDLSLGVYIKPEPVRTWSTRTTDGLFSHLPLEAMDQKNKNRCRHGLFELLQSCCCVVHANVAENDILV